MGRVAASSPEAWNEDALSGGAAGSSVSAAGASPGPAPSLVPLLDVALKLLLVAFLVRLALDPAWGNLEGKAPVARAIIYPCLGLVVPALYLARRRGQPFPWGADLLVTLAGFSDILGNRLDLYDRIDWFDDAIHLVNTGCIAAAAVLITTPRNAPVGLLVDRALAVGVTVALGWELWEYVAFVTRSRESVSAYADTLTDLALGWVGALVAAGLVAMLRADRPGASRNRTEGTDPWHTL